MVEKHDEKNCVKKMCEKKDLGKTLLKKRETSLRKKSFVGTKF